MPGRAYWPDSSVEAVNALSWSNTASAITDSLSGLKQQVDQLTTATLPPLPSLPSLDDLTQRWFPSSDQAPQSQSDQAAGGSFATVPDTAPGPLQRALKPLQDLTAGWGSSATPAAAVYPDAGGVVQTRQPAPSGAATSTPAEMPTAQPAIEQPASSAPAAPAALPDRLDTSSREANLRQWAPALQDVERRTGLRADSMAAIIQAENGGGQSPLSANDNNYFSITAVPGRPNQAGVGQGGRFAHYNSPQDSLNDFVDLIQKHYPEAWANRSDPQKFFAGLVKGGYIVPEPGFPVETWLTNLETGRQHFNQLAPAAAPPPANIPGPDLSPNGTPITAPSQERPRGPYSGTYTQQSLANAGDPDAWSKCGPVAALQASALLGGNLDPATVERLAKQRGWTASAGMAGLQSEAGLLNDMNIAAKAEQGPVDWQRVIADVQRGNPVILQLPGHEGHYVTAQAYDPQTGRIDFGSTVGDLRAAKHQTKFTPQELEGLGWGSPNGALWIDNPATPAPSVVAGNSGTSSITPPRPDASDAAASVTAPTAASMTDRMATTLGQPTMYRQPLQPTAGPDTFPTDQQPPATQAIPNEDPTATPRPAYVPPAMPLVLQNDDSGSNVSPVSSNPDTSTVAPPPSPYDQQQAASMEPPPASGQALPDRFSTPSESPLKPVWDAGGTVIGYVHAGLDAVDRSINAPVAPPGSPQARALQTVGINPDALPAGGPFGAAERTVRDLPAHLASLPAANQQAVTETADAIVQSARATGQDIQQGNVLAAVGDGLMTGLNAANALYAPLARDIDHLLPDFGVGPLGAGDIALNTSVPHDVVNIAQSAGQLVANGVKATPKVLAALRNGVSVDDILQRAGGVIDAASGAARAGAERTAAAEAERAGPGATAYGTLGAVPPERPTIGRGGAPMAPKPGQRLSSDYVYHNTTQQALDGIEREGFSAGSFSDRPIDFGGDVWVAVRKDALPDLQTHQYGGATAYEPNFVTGYDDQGFPIHRAIPPDQIVITDKQGRVIRSLAQDTGPPAIEPPGRPTTTYGTLGSLPPAEQAGTAAHGVFGVAPPEAGPAAEAVARPRFVPPDVRERTTPNVELPDDPRFQQAVENTGGQITARGVEVYVTRAQGEAAAGQTATRGGVFVEPVRPGGRSSYMTSSDNPNAVGGAVVLPPTKTLYRKPLVVDEAPGGMQGFNQAIQKLGMSDPEALAQARRDANDVMFRLANLERTLGYRAPEVVAARNELNAANDVVERLKQSAFTGQDIDEGIRAARDAGPEGSPARAAALKDLVSKYGGDPALIDDLLKIRGADASESAWAIKENIVAANARRQGYDGVFTMEDTGEPNWNAINQHPLVVKAYEDFKAANAALQAADAAHQAAPSASNWRAYQQAERAAQAAADAYKVAQQEAERLVGSAKLTEIFDVQQGRNPTPGPVNPRLDELRTEIQRIDAEQARIPESDPRWEQNRQQRNSLQLEWQRTRSTAGTIGSPGYSLHPDVVPPSQGAAATAGIAPVPVRSHTDVLASVNKALSQGVASAVSGGVGAATNQQLNPDDPNAAAKGFVVGAVAPYALSRGARTLARAAGREARPAGGALATLGHVPPGGEIRAPTIGAETTAFGANPGERVRFRFRVVPLEDLVTSHTNSLGINPDFPRELQPRIRDRAASGQQINSIMQRFDPGQMLVDTHTVDRGPMIVGPDNVVESGNGRSIALRRLAQEKPAEYRRYVDELRGSLPDYGLTPTALEGIDHPVLVRERASDVNRAEFAAGANVSAAAEMAPIERAMQDAGRLDDEHVTRLTVGDGQSIDQALLSPDNRDVVRAFVGAVPESERGALLDASGNLNAYGLERLKSALLAKTYTGEAGARIATAFVESTDPGVRNVENAVYASLPAVARSEALVASGERDASLSVAPDVATAIDVYARLKRAGMSVGDYLAQGALFGDRETTPVQDQILQYMNDNARSPRRIRDMLEGYAQAVDQQVSPDQVGMFGEASRATKEEVLNGITRELGAAPADTGADVGRVGAGGEELARAIQGPSAVPEPSTGAPALSAADESRQRFERAQAAAQGPVSQPRTPASEIIPATGGPEGRLAQEGAPAPPGVAPRRFTAPAEALAASHGAIGEPNPTSPSAGTSRLEVVRRWIVRQATDNMVDLAELQKDAQRALGRPLTAEEMITEQTRVNPAGASKVTIDERIKPVLQGLDDSRPVVTLPAGQALTQRSALTQAMVLANNRDVAVALNTPTRVFSGGLTGADSEAALQHLISNMAPKDQRAVAGGMRELNGVVETYRQKLVDAGVWSQDFADEMRQRYPNWVPTKILDYMADADKSGGVGTRSISMRDRGVRQYTLEGTLKSREDPIASLIRYVDESEARIQKNEVFQGFANLYDALKANPESGWANLVKEVPNSATAAAGRGERTVQGFINGERRTFIASPAVSAAVRMEQGTQIPIIRDVTRLFRELITRTPVFVAGQIPLDAMAAIVRTSNLEGGPQYAPKVAAEIVKGYATAFSGLLSNEFKGDAARYMREGGAMAGFYQRGIDAASHTVDSLTRRSMFEIKDAGDAANLAKWLAGGGWVQAVGQRVELGPRIAAFRMGEQRALRAGADPATAALQGVMAGRNSTMDFQVGGAAAKVINQAVPFFNVGVQSSVTLARIARENPKAFPFTMAALVAAPTVAAEAWNRSDPQRAQDYADVPEYIKDRGIVFMLPGVTGKDEQGNPKPNFAIIPLRELAPVAILTRELAASAMRSAGMEGQDSPRGWGALLGAAASSASPVQANSAADLFSSMNPVGINTGLQLATNRDYFRNRDIATERNDQQASALARGAASAINAVTGSQIRPSQTDFAIRDLTGGAGAAASAASDLVAGRTKDEQRIQSTPVVGGIVRRFVGDTTGGQLEKARDTRISERARGIVNETGLRDDQLTPVGTTIENVPLLQREQTAYQARTNRYFEQEIVKARGAAAWRTNPQDRQQMVRDALSTAKERAATDVMQAIPPAERQRRVGQAARQKAS